MRRIIGSLIVVTALTGCGHHGGGLVVLTAFAVGAALADNHEERTVVVHDVVYVGAPPPPVVEPAPGPTPPRAIAFDVRTARDVLGKVDVERCRAEGAPSGYGHAKITFAASGAVRNVVIDSPAGLSPKAVACIGDAYGLSAVPAFSGSDVTVGTTWLLR